MKLNYDEAIENLKKMFSGVDEEVIQSILVMHKGKIDPTIEDLLKLTNDAADDDNIFDEPAIKQSNNYDNAGFGGGLGAFENDFDKQEQEERDMRLALQLQEKYIKENQMASQSYSRRPQSQGYQAGQGGRPISNQYSNNYDPLNRYNQPQQQRYPQQQQPNIYQQPQYQPKDQLYKKIWGIPEQQQQKIPGQNSDFYPEEKKKKKKFSEKMKDAKIKFLSLFKKTKKKGKAGTGNNSAGGYAEIDNIDDINNLNVNNINEGVNNLRLDDDLDDIPDIQINPYASANNNNKRQDESDESGSVDDDEINEEAKANFNFNGKTNYNVAGFDNIKPKSNVNYPQFDDVEDPDLKEYYNNKNIKDQGGNEESF